MLSNGSLSERVIALFPEILLSPARRSLESSTKTALCWPLTLLVSPGVESEKRCSEDDMALETPKATTGLSLHACLPLYWHLASYGSLARFRDVERLIKVGNTTIIGASGDISDFQYITHLLEKIL